MDIPISQKTKEFEHKYLRAEIDANKSLVFERALLIVGAALAATIVPEAELTSRYFGAPILLALAFNLWFSVNRLKSNARIISYIQLVHESESISWEGWESALRLHRIFLKKCKDRLEEARKKYGAITQYDNISFYGPIFWFHVVMAFFIALFLSLLPWISDDLPRSAITIEIDGPIILNTLGLMAFLVWSIKVRPESVKKSIEINRIIWEEVFDAFENNELEDKNVVLNELLNTDL